MNNIRQTLLLVLLGSIITPAFGMETEISDETIRQVRQACEEQITLIDAQDRAEEQRCPGLRINRGGTREQRLEAMVQEQLDDIRLGTELRRTGALAGFLGTADEPFDEARFEKSADLKAIPFVQFGAAFQSERTKRVHKVDLISYIPGQEPKEHMLPIGDIRAFFEQFFKEHEHAVYLHKYFVLSNPEYVIRDFERLTSGDDQSCEPSDVLIPFENLQLANPDTAFVLRPKSAGSAPAESKEV